MDVETVFDPHRIVGRSSSGKTGLRRLAGTLADQHGRLHGAGGSERRDLLVWRGGRRFPGRSGRRGDNPPLARRQRRIRSRLAGRCAAEKIRHGCRSGWAHPAAVTHHAAAPARTQAKGRTASSGTSCPCGVPRCARSALLNSSASSGMWRTAPGARGADSSPQHLEEDAIRCGSGSRRGPC